MNKLHLTSLKLVAFAAASLLLGGTTVRAQVAPFSPEGTWDLVFSGSQKGLAVITFNSDNTLTGYEIVRPAPHKGASVDVDERHPGVEDPGRTAVTTTPSGSTSKVVTNFLGSAPMNGVWYTNTSKKIIGILNQLSQTVEPVEMYSTNQLGEVVTNITYVVKTETNAVSFKASAAQGSRITICTYGPNGNNTLRGPPATINTNLLSGDFYAAGNRDGLNFVEFLNLVQDSVIPNRYDVTGMGPGYTFTGRALVSNSKQIAIVTLDGTTLLSVYTGPFNLKSFKGNLGGLDSNSKKLTYNVSPLP